LYGRSVDADPPAAVQKPARQKLSRAQEKAEEVKKAKAAVKAKAAAKLNMGRGLWNPTHVVFLGLNWRQKDDQPFLAMCNRVREGIGTVGSEPTSDYQKLRNHKLDKEPLSIQRTFAQHGTFLVGFNKAKMAIDRAYVSSLALQLGVPILVASAVDNFGGREPTLAQRVEFLRLPDAKTGGLAGLLDLVLGCEVMIKKSPFSVLGLANGSRGTLVKIGLHEADLDSIAKDKPRAGERHYLTHPLQWAWIKLHDAHGIHLKGFPPGVVPLQVESSSSTVRAGKAKVSFNLTRKQCPFTVCKALTFQISQGQTIRLGVMSWMKPERGNIDPRAYYVGLTRFPSFDSFRMVGDFDPSVLRTPPSQALLDELEHLKAIAVETKVQLVKMERRFEAGDSIFELATDEGTTSSAATQTKSRPAPFPPVSPKAWRKRHRESPSPSSGKKTSTASPPRKKPRVPSAPPKTPSPAKSTAADRLEVFRQAHNRQLRGGLPSYAEALGEINGGAKKIIGSGTSGQH